MNAEKPIFVLPNHKHVAIEQKILYVAKNFEVFTRAFF